MSGIEGLRDILSASKHDTKKKLSSAKANGRCFSCW